MRQSPLREQARLLRSEGLSLAEIAEQLHTHPSHVSRLVRGVALTEEQRTRLRDGTRTAVAIATAKMTSEQRAARASKAARQRWANNRTPKPDADRPSLSLLLQTLLRGMYNERARVEADLSATQTKIASIEGALSALIG